jgi:hypothetical protein
MHTPNRAWLAGGSVAAFVAVALLAQTPVAAVQNGNGNGNAGTKDVTVINTDSNPVPVSGNVVVSGSTSVNGSVAASQSGAWTMRIDPAHNQVSLPAGSSFWFDSGLGVINDGGSVDLGPFDTSDLAGLRLLGRAVNGDVHVEVLANVDGFPITIDSFTMPGESGSVSRSFVYDYPPPSVTIHMTESGPGGSNYHIALVGR